MTTRSYAIDQLIINSPYGEPTSYWSYHRQTRLFTRKGGRRPAGYVTATPGSKSFDDPGIFRELPLVNQIRPRVKAWREANYPNVTGITRRLLEHWQDPEERQERRFFFCQLEAIETLIWLVVPFTFLPHEGGQGTPPPPPSHKTEVRPLRERRQFEIRWPNVLRVDHVYTPVLRVDMDSVSVLEIDALGSATQAELAPVLEGKPDITHLTEIDLRELGKRFRMQKIVFEVARDVYDEMKPSWKGNREFLLAQLIGLVEQFLGSDRVRIVPAGVAEDDLRRRILLTLNMSRIVHHIWQAIREENAEQLCPVFDTMHPIRSTGEMRTWYTGRPCERTKRSHINFCVYDSTWEATEAYILERDPHVEAWVKNDHLGFEVLYVFNGVVRKYRPDFLVRLTNGKMLVLEVKGQDTPQNVTKHKFLDEWTRAVNAHGGFGVWGWDVSRQPGDVAGILAKHGSR